MFMKMTPAIRRPYKWALLITIILLVMWVFPFSLFDRWEDAPKLTVSFLGFTNISPNMKAAIFGITNRSGSSVKLWKTCQIEIEGVTVPLTSTTRFLDTNLEPGNGFITVTGLPPRPAKWRAGWGFSRRTLHERLTDSLKKMNQRLIVVDWDVPHEMHLLTSEWFPPDNR